jgi:glycosyltransferase involved in cell wall biosynthesis
MDGEPKHEWKNYFIFHKINMPPYKFIKSKTIRWYFSLEKLYRQVKDVNVDVIYTLSGFWVQEFSRYCSRKMKLPYVVRLRGNHREVRKVIVANALKRKLFNYLETRSLKNASLILPISRRLARVAREWGVDESKVSEPVPVGVDTKVFKPMNVERASEFTVGYAGRISPEKGINHLVDIAKKLPDVHFLVAGKRQMNISFPRNVEYLGEMPFFKMATFYNRVDLIILPSLTEGFPCVILEAYACEKPVLVAKNVFPEELEVFGSVANIGEFEVKIRKLKDMDLEEVGRKAREYVERYYSWERFGRTVVHHLKRALIKKRIIVFE